MMNKASRIHVSLVCHTEPDVWDGGFTSIDYVLPKLLDLFNEIHDNTGTTPRVTWCLTSQVAQQRPGSFRELMELGHEIGIHSHFPAASGKLEHQQEINRDNLGKFQEWFPQLYSLIVDVGFPPPRTHVSWMFAYRDSMTQVLAAAGILVDCSVCYGGMHYLPDRFLLADSRNRRSGKPYRLDESNHCAEGSSTVIELPVSGGLADYWEPDEKGEFRYFYPVASDTEIDRQLQLFQKRLDTLSMLEVDIFHIHFHLYDFLLPNGIAEERLKRVKWLLTSMAYDTRVYFSNASEAADDWSQEHEI